MKKVIILFTAITLGLLVAPSLSLAGSSDYYAPIPVGSSANQVGEGNSLTKTDATNLRFFKHPEGSGPSFSTADQNNIPVGSSFNKVNDLVAVPGLLPKKSLEGDTIFKSHSAMVDSFTRILGKANFFCPGSMRVETSNGDIIYLAIDCSIGGIESGVPGNRQLEVIDVRVDDAMSTLLGSLDPMNGLVGNASEEVLPYSLKTYPATIGEPYQRPGYMNSPVYDEVITYGLAELKAGIVTAAYDPLTVTQLQKIAAAYQTADGTLGVTVDSQVEEMVKPWSFQSPNIFFRKDHTNGRMLLSGYQSIGMPAILGAGNSILSELVNMLAYNYAPIDVKEIEFYAKKALRPGFAVVNQAPMMALDSEMPFDDNVTDKRYEFREYFGVGSELLDLDKFPHNMVSYVVFWGPRDGRGWAELPRMENMNPNAAFRAYKIALVGGGMFHSAVIDDDISQRLVVPSGIPVMDENNGEHFYIYVIDPAASPQLAARTSVTLPFSDFPILQDIIVPNVFEIVPPDGGFAPYGVDASDFNGDGCDDIVLTFRGAETVALDNEFNNDKGQNVVFEADDGHTMFSNVVKIYLGQEVEGLCVFDEDHKILVNPSMPNFDAQIADAKFADVNKDGYMDLVLGDLMPHQLDDGEWTGMVYVCSSTDIGVLGGCELVRSGFASSTVGPVMLSVTPPIRDPKYLRKVLSEEIVGGLIGPGKLDTESQGLTGVGANIAAINGLPIALPPFGCPEDDNIEVASPLELILSPGVNDDNVAVPVRCGGTPTIGKCAEMGLEALDSDDPCCLDVKKYNFLEDETKKKCCDSLIDTDKCDSIETPYVYFCGACEQGTTDFPDIDIGEGFGIDIPDADIGYEFGGSLEVLPLPEGDDDEESDDSDGGTMYVPTAGPVVIIPGLDTPVVPNLKGACPGMPHVPAVEVCCTNPCSRQCAEEYDSKCVDTLNPNGKEEYCAEVKVKLLQCQEQQSMNDDEQAEGAEDTDFAYTYRPDEVRTSKGAYIAYAEALVPVESIVVDGNIYTPIGQNVYYESNPTYGFGVGDVIVDPGITFAAPKAPRLPRGQVMPGAREMTVIVKADLCGNGIKEDDEVCEYTLSNDCTIGGVIPGKCLGDCTCWTNEVAECNDFPATDKCNAANPCANDALCQATMNENTGILGPCLCEEKPIIVETSCTETDECTSSAECEGMPEFGIGSFCSIECSCEKPNEKSMCGDHIIATDEECEHEPYAVDAPVCGEGTFCRMCKCESDDVPVIVPGDASEVVVGEDDVKCKVLTASSEEMLEKLRKDSTEFVGDPSGRTDDERFAEPGFEMLCVARVEGATATDISKFSGATSVGPGNFQPYATYMTKGTMLEDIAVVQRNITLVRSPVRILPIAGEADVGSGLSAQVTVPQLSSSLAPILSEATPMAVSSSATLSNGSEVINHMLQFSVQPVSSGAALSISADGSTAPLAGSDASAQVVDSDGIGAALISWRFRLPADVASCPGCPDFNLPDGLTVEDVANRVFDYEQLKMILASEKSGPKPLKQIADLDVEWPENLHYEVVHVQQVLVAGSGASKAATVGGAVGSVPSSASASDTVISKDLKFAIFGSYGSSVSGGSGGCGCVVAGGAPDLGTTLPAILAFVFAGGGIVVGRVRRRRRK
jgi:hypothetical protein